MADNARGIHVSPGIYAKETELTYAVKSLGITTLGVVGETQRGPAFQPMLIENWREFQSVFGGTSTEKFSGSQYPKYELPYIAKSYLTESNQLKVCRVLGLSGYNAGPAWVMTANLKNQENKKMVVAVLRSRGYYEDYHKYDSTVGDCECPQQTYDTLFYRVGERPTAKRDCSRAIDYNGNALALKEFTPLDSEGNECVDYKITKVNGVTGIKVTSIDSGRFKIVGVEGAYEGEATNANKVELGNRYFEYPVSFNPNDKEYIYKVLGSDPLNGDAPIYVEALYDVALKQLIESEDIEEINLALEFYQVYHKSDYCFLKPVNDIINKQEESLSRRYVGYRFLADKNAEANKIHCHPYDFSNGKPFVKGNIQPSITKLSEEIEDLTRKIGEASSETEDKKKLEAEKAKKENEKKSLEALKKTAYYESLSDKDIVYDNVKPGQIYTVRQHTSEDGKRHYYYTYNVNVPEVSDKFSQSKRQEVLDKLNFVTGAESESRYSGIVKNNADGKYYRMAETGESSDIVFVSCDMNDYRDAYRFASTPWIVSNVKGDFDKIELNKLFRFHTISDGSSSNNEVKISIQNVRLDEGTFDVVVRAINDTDDSQVVLERFSHCTMKPNTQNYIAYKIGSYDGLYESKSKYITVEVNETDAAVNSVPAGFLGYPLSNFAGTPIVGSKKELVAPIIKYNLNYDVDVKNRKQYFGLSSIVGVDYDMFSYKGNAAYSQEPSYLSQGFHLDSRMNMDSYADNEKPEITVDGVTGYTFDAVSTNNRTHILDGTPVIGTEMEMNGSIYEYVDLRKFTVYFYGGFDGWDAYRGQRSNTDNFKRTKYLGEFNENSGEGLSFNAIENPEVLKLNQPAITSDLYAYLSAIRQFSNPEEVDINVFATPGIDLVNNKLLTQEVIEMIEEERADSIYVATMPDKPMGANDYVDEMYTPDDVVYELEDTEIDSNYTCTYYPWIKYEDVDNSQYIYLPPTKDVVRNMAMTDNTTHPWFAPAGISRGDVNCVRAHYVTKLSDEDVLYEGRINPIKTFASDGVKVWGQKNLQKRESQLNRIAVRRLLLRIRKLVAISCIGLIFEPNDSTTKNKFLSTVTPILDNIKANRGISDYKIEVNDTLEARERRELPAKIFFKPYNALEYIDLNFILTPEGVSFDNI